MSQTRAQSFVEAIANTALGLVVSMAAVQWILPIFGVRMTLAENAIATAVMTVVSVIRAYGLRRFFNWLHGRAR